MTASVTLMCFMAISICSAKGPSYAVCEERRNKGKHISSGDLEYHPRLLLEEEGIKASKQMQYFSSQKLHWDH